MSVGELAPPTPVSAGMPTETTPRWRANWIVNPWTDLPWLIGGVLAGYALFALSVAIGWDMAVVGLIYYATSNLPHFFGTYVRTYLDPQEWRRQRRLLLTTLLVFLVGPCSLLLCLALYLSGQAVLTEQYELPFHLFFVFTGLWAYWHLVRQHYGIMSLYKRKNHDSAVLDRWLDWVVLYIGLLAPFVAFLMRHELTRERLGLPEVPLPNSWEALVVPLTVGLLVLAVLAFALRQGYRWRQRAPLNLPKILLLSAVIPLHVLVAYHPFTLTAALIGFGAFVTIAHDIQYHAIVWHAQMSRLHRPGVDRKQHGLAALICRHLLIYLACALAFGVGSWVLGCFVGMHQRGCGLVFATDTALPMHRLILFGDITLGDLFFTLAIGFAMHHYLLDQFIWRPSKDKELRRELLTTETTAARSQ